MTGRMTVSSSVQSLLHLSDDGVLVINGTKESAQAHRTRGSFAVFSGGFQCQALETVLALGRGHLLGVHSSRDGRYGSLTAEERARLLLLSLGVGVLGRSAISGNMPPGRPRGWRGEDVSRLMEETVQGVLERCGGGEALARSAVSVCSNNRSMAGGTSGLKTTAGRRTRA